jgi:hypothetical protein
VSRHARQEAHEQAGPASRATGLEVRRGVTGGNWYLVVKTLHDTFRVDVGSDPAADQVALGEAKARMGETGSVTIGGSLVVMASDIESIALQDEDAAAGL